MPPVQTFQRTAPGAQQAFQQAQGQATQARTQAQQLPQRQQAMRSFTGGDPRAQANQNRQMFAQQNIANNQAGQAERAAETARQAIPAALAADNRNEGYDVIRGRIGQMANDPTDQFIRQRLQQAAGPDGGPFNEATRNAMFTAQAQQGGQMASNESARIMEDAARRGLSADDPGVRAALARVQTQQGQGAQRARLGVDLVANPANYAAQQSAVDRLGSYSQSQNQAMLSAEDRLRQMLMNERFTQGDNQPDYSSYIRS